ncbi:hypothetical protein [Paenibacillus sp. 481]|uniref:hypothetical protein n=1 Tax=Paenibacillus sp. 481 TaxID=2835869 RepID=UPI001E5F1CEB|nr:hypothetical protein [Paenibacillus sp. 481]UHA73587.1 hypothetical protein KIK04_24110 [Paenibacillus sp. 481]
MTRTKVQTFKHKIGKNHFFVLKIIQHATAKAKQGNVLASNAVNVKVFKHKKHEDHSKRRHHERPSKRRKHSRHY